MIPQTAVGYLTKILQVLINEKSCIGFETLVVTTGAQLLQSIPTGANNAIVQVESTNNADAIRMRIDGIAPTSTIGMVFGNTSLIELTTAEDISRFLIIKGAGGGTSSINVIYSK